MYLKLQKYCYFEPFYLDDFTKFDDFTELILEE